MSAIAKGILGYLYLIVVYAVAIYGISMYTSRMLASTRLIVVCTIGVLIIRIPLSPEVS